MRKLSIAILVAGIALTSVLTGCGGGGGGGGSKGNNPPSSTDTIVTGNVIDTNGAKVPNVTVQIGALPAVKTNAQGAFSINLGAGTRLIDLFPAQNCSIIMSTESAGQYYPEAPITYPATAPNTTYNQIWSNGGATITIPYDLWGVSSQTINLGSFKVIYWDSSTAPPPPY